MTDPRPAPAFAPDKALKPPRNQWWDVWDQFKTHKGAIVGASVFVLILLAVLIGPYLWPLGPTTIDIKARNQGPSWAHPMGADQLGRDIFARMGRPGQRAIYALANLPRHYTREAIEAACTNVLTLSRPSYQALKRVLEHQAKPPAPPVLEQTGASIRAIGDYQTFWDRYTN